MSTLNYLYLLVVPFTQPTRKYVIYKGGFFLDSKEKLVKELQKLKREMNLLLICFRFAACLKFMLVYCAIKGSHKKKVKAWTSLE